MARPQGRRVPLAAWIAGLGALLLLAAAATFLAVSWDVLGATARIAIVGGLTAAAVVGGHRLRRTLPVVGTVVFHLGALLLPVDALGLVLQLDGPVWLRWVAAGATAVVALPLLALAGRAPVLAGLSLLGVPVLATGVALASGPAPAVLVALVGVVLLPLADHRSVPPSLAPLPSLGSVALPAAAVVLGLAAELLAALPTAGLSAAAADAGWIAGWEVRAGVAVLVVVTLAVRARAGDPRLVTVAIATGVLALLHLVLPEATPRAVRLWTPALAWLALEAAVLAVRRPEPGGAGLRVAALVAELIALPVVLLAITVVSPPAGWWQVDAVLAGVLAIAAATWMLAGVRLERDRRSQHLGVPAWLLPTLLVVSGWHVVAVPVLLGASTEVVVVLAGVLALLPALARRPQQRAVQPLDVLVGELLAAVALLAAAASAAAGGRLTVLVAVLVPAALLPLLAPIAKRPDRASRSITGMATASMLVTVVLLADDGLRAAQLPVGLGGILVGATAIALAQVTAPVRGVATGARIVALFAAMATSLPVGWGLPAGASGVGDGARLVTQLGLDAGALFPAFVLGILLALDALVDRGPVTTAGVALVAVRLVTVVALVAGVELAVVGAALLALGVAAAVLAVLSGQGLAEPRISAGAALAVTAIPLGWVLLGDAALLRASALLTVGVLLLLTGMGVRRLALAHIGAAIATLGTWSLLIELDVTALDLWLLPVAVQILLAGVSARRSGPTSSWVAEAPAVALVGVPAVLERLVGGPGWHGLLAGAVGIVAVISGGRWARRGPLVVGTVVVVAIVAVETLAVVASLPTWAWLTVGGVVLLVTAASIERLGQTPRDAARRVAAGLRDPDPAGDEPAG